MVRNQEDLPRRNTNLNWRTRIEHSRLVSQASSILLQRQFKFWAPLLRRLRLSSNFNPTLFNQILTKIKSHPEICINFFNFSQKSLDFEPDLTAKCEVSRILLSSRLPELGMPVLNSIVQDHPPETIMPLMIQSSEEQETLSPVFSSVVECYCSKNLHLEGLEVYRMAKRNKVELGLGCCNALLDILCNKNEVRSAWCCLASMIRSNISLDHSTWTVIARLWYKDGEFERILRILDMGIHAHEVFDLMIDGHCRRGDFEAAFVHLNKMSSHGIDPSFATYSSILDGASKYQAGNVVETIISSMAEKGHIISPSAPEFYDAIIQKLCVIGKTFAVEHFYKRARDLKVELQHGTYRCILKALLSEEGRISDAITLYNTVQGKNISLDMDSIDKFVDSLCKEAASREFSRLLVAIIKGGSISNPKGLSAYISKQCSKHQWRDAEKLMDVALDRGFMLDSISCGCFVKRYCRTGRIDKAIALQSRLEELQCDLDIGAYEVFLAALFRGKRGDEAMKVFEYMRGQGVTSSESFSIMIRGLCEEKELRMAMKLHDEMVHLGLKPGLKAYKRLISGFGNT
ncbi:pentatricopeptide repeat-containing protein At4g21170 [Andrographis paniculata]|uniref:pentatricopeptide repeat-containing protein At4g21170 n=1 Tax=Andrographis paniculata TaxID=175694 RepID=UPI0021E729EC|nr:pentatricopeptide repeat-containing protein At4g21170 [Andrographis paniculata]